MQALLLGGVGIVVGYYLGSVLSSEMTREPSLKVYTRFFDNVEIPAHLEIKVMARSTGNMLVTVGVVQCMANIIAIYCLMKEFHLPLLCVSVCQCSRIKCVFLYLYVSF